jgi:type II secretory pathway predicted ATPase ExeA
MYLDNWKLACRPFDERIDPNWFFASGVHQGAVLQMRSIIERRQRLALVTGAVGSGKSMVVTRAADQCAENCVAITLRGNALTVADVLEGIVTELKQVKTLGLDPSQVQPGSIELAELLKRQLMLRGKAGQYIVAFLDPTNDVSEDELGNLQRTIESFGEACPLTVFLVGSTELLVKTRRLGCRGFPQCVLGPMAPADTVLYIRHRILRAGGDPAIFSAAALELIHDLCGGLPRRINRLCDLCLLVGYSKNCDPITHSLVWDAQAEIRVLTPSRTALAAPTRRWRPLGKRSRVEG